MGKGKSNFVLATNLVTNALGEESSSLNIKKRGDWSSVLFFMTSPTVLSLLILSIKFKWLKNKARSMKIKQEFLECFMHNQSYDWSGITQRWWGNSADWQFPRKSITCSKWWGERRKHEGLKHFIWGTQYW